MHGAYVKFWLILAELVLLQIFAGFRHYSKVVVAAAGSLPGWFVALFGYGLLLLRLLLAKLDEGIVYFVFAVYFSFFLPQLFFSS